MAATPPTTTTPIPAQPAVVSAANAHGSFLLLIGEVVGVLILSWVASIDDRIGAIIVAFLLVLWLLWIINNAGANGVVQTWAAKVGL